MTRPADIDEMLDASLEVGAEPSSLIFPTSFAQQRLWFLSQLDVGSSAYNTGRSLLLRGPLNVRALEAAVAEIVARHEVLRTTYSVEQGEPVQVIAPFAGWSLPIIDLSGLESRADDEARQRVVAMADRSFDLARDLPLRVELYRLAPDRHVLAICMHHIATDGRSAEILLRELRLLYEASAAGQTQPLAELPLQYADYAVWQREQLQGETLERELGYWRRKMAGAPTVLQLATDRPRPRAESHRGALQPVELDAATVERLRTLGRGEGATLFMAVLAAFQLFLSRWSGDDDIVVGTPVAGRNRPELDDLIGLFANTVALRTSLAGTPSFRTLLHRVRETALEAFAHQDLPFERVVEALGVERSLSHAPVFQALLAIQSGPTSDASLQFSEAHASVFGTPGHTAKFDISLYLREHQGALRGAFEYATDLFRPATLDRMASHFARLVRSAVAEPDRSIWDLEMATDAERALVLESWSRGDDAQPFVSIPDLFHLQAVRTPDAIAIRHDGRGVTYEELDAQASRIASMLHARGIAPEERIGICLTRTPRMIAAMLGVMRAGGAYVPLDPEYPAERLAYVVADLASPLVVTEAKLADRVPCDASRLIVLDRDPEDVVGDNDWPTVAPRSLAYVIYTSGSTGRPKGVAVEHEGASELVGFMRTVGDAENRSAVLGSTSMSFDISIAEIFGTLCWGGTLVLVDDLLHLPRVVNESIRTIFAPPSVAGALLRAGEIPSTVRQFNVGGEALPPELARALYALPHVDHVFNCYGPTEDTVYSTSCPVARDVERVPIGRSLSGRRAYVRDAAGHLSPPGAPGELYLGGIGVARGYLNRPGLTAERFVPDPFSGQPGARLYRTGDRARWREDGQLDYFGRSDAQVKVRGYRIEPGEIEAALRDIENIGDAGVIAREDTPGDVRLVAYLVPPPGRELPNLDVVRGALRSRLPEYMVPASFVALPELPLTPNGKVDRRALPAPEYDASASVAPRTPLEQTLASIWCEVLRVDRIGIDDNFFAIGGHSLLVMQVASRVRSALGVDLPLRAVFESPTIAELAHQLAESHGAGGTMRPMIGRADRSRPLPLSFTQRRLWFLEQLSPGNAYTIFTALRLGGALDGVALEKALCEIVRRHEPLRTVFAGSGDDAVQVILPVVEWPLPVTDVSRVEPRERRMQTEARAKALALEPWDLARGPVFRAEMVRLGRDEHILLWAMHHIAGDGWSTSVFRDELQRLYGAFARGERSPLADLPLQYADFAVWQRDWLRGDVLEEQLAYWREALRDAPPVLELPADHPRPPMPSYRGSSRGFGISAATTEALEALARGEGATLFMALVAVFSVALSRWSGQRDVVVGTPIAGRNDQTLEKLIGFFANSLALRTDLSGRPSFRTLLRQVRETTLDAYAHQDLPFERLVDALGLGRDLSRNPVFQAALVVQNVSAPPGARAPGDLIVETAPFGGVSAKFDLTLAVDRRADGMAVALVYATDLFDDATAERFAAHLSTLVESVIATPDTPVTTVPMLPASERELLDRFSGGGSASSRLLHEVVAAHALATPAAEAIVSGGERITYGDLDARANRLAHFLRARGVVEESRVAVLIDRAPSLVEAMLAMLKAGGAYVPLDPSFPKERLAFMLADSGASVLVTRDASPTAVELAGEQGLALVDLARVDLQSCSSTAPPAVALSPDNLAYVIYTSGSTGTPKGTLVSHRAIPGYQDSYLDGALRQGDVETWLQYSSVSWDALTLELWTPLWRGARCQLYRAEAEGGVTVEGIERAVVDGGVTHIWLTAALFNAIVDTNVRALESLRVILVGGDALSVDHMRRAREALPTARLVNGYGPSECTVFATCDEIGEIPAGATLSIGRPIGDRRCYVLDPDGEVVPVGVAGELCIGGPAVPRGYLGRGALTASRVVPDAMSGDAGARLYRSNDRARWRTDGRIEFLGRLDDQVKIRGYRVEPGEIEALLLTHADVRESAVVVREDPRGERVLLAYATSAPGRGADGRVLRDWLRERVPAYMLPATVSVLDAFPLTSTNKIDRRALPWPAELDGAEDFVAPRTPVEEMLASIWSEVLARPRISVRDDFFLIGGHSIAATQVVSRLRAAFDIELPLRTLFEHPVLEALAERVDSARRAGAATLPTIVRLPTADARRRVSFAQERYCFLERLFPGSPTYNVPYAMELRGALDVEALGRAVDEMVRRHEVLRSSFVGRDGDVSVLVSPPPTHVLRIEDLRGLPRQERTVRAQEAVDLDARAPFSLERGPMFRAGLLRLADDENILTVTMHHIATDGVSMSIFFRELAALYERFVDGLPLPPHDDRTPQYADYAAWQRMHLADGVIAEQLTWWTQHLAGAPAFLELPLDRPRPSVQTHRGTSLNFSLEPELSAALVSRARAEGVTLYMLLLAAFQLLLSRWSGQEDVVIGSVVAGRSRKEIENIVGCFVNTIALRGRLGGVATFRDLLRQVRENTLDAYARQELPFERLVEALQPERSLAHSPVFQVMFSQPQAPPNAIRFGALEARRIGARGAVSKFDLQLFMVEHATGLRGSLEYATDLFDQSTIEALVEQYTVLLQTIVALPESRLDALPLMDAPARDRALHEWNPKSQATIDAGDTLHGRFAARVRSTPQAVAVSCDGVALTYEELNTRAEQLAHGLRARGARPEARVALCLERSLDMVVAILAVLKSGAAYVPLDPTAPADRLAFVLSDSRAAVLITQSTLVEQLRAHDAATILVDAPDEGYESGEPIVPTSADNVAYVIYTSGSTGRPKGVEITHANVLRLFDETGEWFRFDERDVWTMFHSYAFDFSVWELWGALLHGGRLVVVPYLVSRTPADVHRLLRREGVTVLNQTPSAFRELMRADEAEPIGLRSLRFVVFGGEALEPSMLAPWLDRYGSSRPRLINMYGITETTVHVTYRPIDASDVRRGSHSPIGEPIRDLQLYILDRVGEPTPIGVPGELYVGGAGLARGYQGRASLTAERFVPDPFSGVAGARLYRTGDRARRLRSGDIAYLGRLDHQVKVRGFRIELGEIESVLEQHPLVQAAVVAAREDRPGDVRLAAYLVLAPGGVASLDDVREQARNRLPDYMVPSSFTVLDALPITTNGKIDRRALPAPDGATGTVGADFSPPRTAAEEMLTRLIGQVVGVATVGVNDDFFALGGHSILALRLMGRIQEAFGRDLPLATLYRGATAADLARFLEEEQQGESSLLVPLQPLGSGPPIYCPHAVGADVFSYEGLAKRLSPDHILYGIRARGLFRGEQALNRTEDLAARYVDALFKHQPEGPYRLLGWSMGGMTAFEMAQQIRAAGREVSLLTVVDTREWLGEQLTHVNALRAMLRDLVQPGFFDEMRALPLDEQVPFARAAIERSGAPPLRIALLDVYHAHHTAWRNYRAQPYDGDVVFIRATEEQLAEGTDPVAYWTRLVRGKLDIHLVPAIHNTIMTEPHVGEVARVVSAHITAGSRA